MNREWCSPSFRPHDRSTGSTDYFPAQPTLKHSIFPAYLIDSLRLFAALALLAVFGGLALAHQHLACVGAPEERFYFSNSPQSCSKYILCLEGKSHIGECDEGLHFDVGQQGCANAQFVDCTRCGPFGFVKLPHEQECGSYYECTFGQRKLRTCPPGHLFDREVGSCNREDLVSSCPGDDIETETPPSLRPSQEDPGLDDPFEISCETGQVHHAHPSDCTKYFLCIRGQLWEHVCPSALNWNERAMACDMPERSGCLGAGDEGGDYGDGDDGGLITWGKNPKKRPGARKPRGTAPIRRLVRDAVIPLPPADDVTSGEEF